MAIKKIVMRPEGTNDYADELYPKTTATQVVEEADKKFMTDAERTKLSTANVTSVNSKTGAVVVTKTDVVLENVDNVKQLPIAGGTMTGILYPQVNTSYTTAQARRVTLSTASPSGGSNGDIWIKYQ